ncbi:hypothetical protein M3223_03710 [Paenibacillus pasadenensis]|uniref:hypothetical protein n=1 Tax=Paenibacillus pasadenensis TaxID=217090 RepID=UPI00203E47A8|nr:hypothetical protein [Paenibacillus pasadenensis]MCM3746453.1 hypothetical protein [Paenibacillus pasadenensis]
MKLIHHPSREEWSAYAAGAVFEPERTAMEQHLAGCGLCLELFMESIELVPAPQSAIPSTNIGHCVEKSGELSPSAEPVVHRPSLNAPSSSAGFAPGDSLERVRQAVLQQLAARPRRRTWTRHPAFHYGLAAALTLLLLLSGTLGELTRELEGSRSPNVASPSQEQSENHPARESWSSHVVNRTSDWLNEWQSARFK